MIFPSRSQLASKQITRTGRAESVTKEGLAATLLLARQPDRMGQRHPLRPVRPRSRPGPLPYVVFQHDCGRYPYVLMVALRRLGLAGTRWAQAQTETIRRGLLKIGAQLKVSVRRVYLSLASGYPDEEAFAAVYRALRPPGFATL